jgi:hypothetical protein
MPAFVKGGATRTPFGKNQYLRSARGVKFESYTLAGATVPARTIDGNANQKILQPGTVMAKITSTADSGKIGPFSAAATDGRQTLANIVGLNDTFLPWQAIERDVEIAVAYECAAVQGWCIELDATSAEIVLTNTTAAAMIRGGAAGKGVDITFK